MAEGMTMAVVTISVVGISKAMMLDRVVLSDELREHE